MPDLPSGTVTLLFTDIEGSTRLLQRHRRAAGLTQEALAERAGLSVRAISDLERGARRAPYRHTVAQLAAALGLAAPDRARLEAARRRRRGTPALATGGAGGHPPGGTVTLLFTDIEGSTPACCTSNSGNGPCPLIRTSTGSRVGGTHRPEGMH